MYRSVHHDFCIASVDIPLLGISGDIAPFDKPITTGIRYVTNQDQHDCHQTPNDWAYDKPSIGVLR
jgi:hypothetical protein